MGLLYRYFTVCILFYTTEHNLKFFHPLQKHCPIALLRCFSLTSEMYYNIRLHETVVYFNLNRKEMLTIRNVYCQQGKCLERSIMRSVCPK